MRIITFYREGSDTLEAMTKEQFEAANQLGDTCFDEWVWQDELSIEVAMLRHDTAFVLWRDEQNAGLPEKEFY